MIDLSISIRTRTRQGGDPLLEAMVSAALRAVNGTAFFLVRVLCARLGVTQ